MEIQLEQVAKKFNREWVFRSISLQIQQSDITAITGPNGSGKSTLLQIIAGSLLHTEGQISCRHHQEIINPEDMYKHLAMVAPAMSLPEDFTLMEFLEFHFKFKTLKAGYEIDALPEIMQLEHATNKYIKNFSTGMKQRLKLGVAFYAEVPLILLDEPATNLDKSGFEWYINEVGKILPEKMVFVCSNRQDEYSFCNNIVDILAYKK